jgi:hypothetical protein
MNALEKQTLKLIGENTDSPDVFTDDSIGMAPIRDSINQAVQQICMATGSYQKKYYLPLRESCQFYRMDWETDYFGYVVNAWDRSRHRRLEQTNVMKLNAEDPSWMKNTGSPERYFHIGYEFIGIYFKPSASNIVLELDCVVIPKFYVADTDPIKMREAFERATVQYAVSEYFASRGDGVKATEWMTRSIETAGLKKLNPTMNERTWQMGGRKEWQPSTNR